MNEWSDYFQNEEFLAKSRYLIMNRDMLPLVARWLRLMPSSKVLDVGCGSGEFTFYLAGETKDVCFTGLDLDGQLVEAARSRASDFGNDNSFQFMQGDALQLPFDDGTFDLVVSQTFLINIPDYRGALQEMKRVCRPGGLVASCTAARIPAVEEAGQYRAFYRNWKPVYDRLFRKAWDMYGKLSPISGRMSGVSPTKVQRIFVDAGLIDVTTYPIGGFFSLSNPTISDEEKKRYLELDYLAETKKLRKWFETVPEAKEYFTEDEVREFEAAAAAKRDALTAAVGENRIWEWQAITMLLVLGTNTGRQSAGW